MVAFGGEDCAAAIPGMPGMAFPPALGALGIRIPAISRLAVVGTGGAGNRGHTRHRGHPRGDGARRGRGGHG